MAVNVPDFWHKAAGRFYLSLFIINHREHRARRVDKGKLVRRTNVR
jgi:hypothetical protein